MKTMYFLLAFASLAILSNMAGAAYNSTVSMVNLSVSPNPVVAGSNVSISFQLNNAYQGTVYSATLQPTGSYPIVNVTPLKGRVIGALNQGLNPHVYNYSIHIPNTTPSGVYTITFVSEYFIYAATGTETATTQMPVSFFVSNKPDIKVVASSPSPAALYSGYNQTVNLVVENIGYGTARNITVDVKGGNGINILSSVDSFFISNLTQGSSVSEPILVSAQNISQTSLVAGITYYSARLSQKFSSTQTVNLSVAPAAQFAIGSLGSGIGIGTTDVPIRFRVTNTGTSAAKDLQLTLETSYPISPVASTAYVGDLSPGYSSNVTFLVTTDSAGVPGNYPVTLTEQWEQPNGAVNQQFSGSTNYFVPVGQTSGSSTTTYIGIGVVIIVVIVAAVVYRRRKAKGAARKKKE